MSREFTFGTGSTVGADFLNNLQALLSTFSDSALPSYTASSVVLQATTGDEIQISIQGEYRVLGTTADISVSGPSSIYSIFAITNSQPSIIGSNVPDFEVAVSTAVPSGYDLSRVIGYAHWDGSQVTDVTMPVHVMNVTHVDGFTGSREPTAGVIPIASSNGKLAEGFRPNFVNVDAQLGEVIDYWYPPGAPSTLPTQWEYCLGQTIPSGSHDLGALDFTLPDFRGRTGKGANPSNPIGQVHQPSNLAAAAPGPGAAYGSTMLNYAALAHTHNNLATHTHVATHRHSASHYHSIASHAHTVTSYDIDYQPGVGTHEYLPLPYTSADIPHGVLSESMSTTMTDYDTSNHTAVIESFYTASYTAFDSRPWGYGLLKIMKVRV